MNRSTYNWHSVVSQIHGFTFIEILIAIAIFVLAVLAAVNIATGSVKATQDAKDVSVATWLLQEKMVEAETKLETEGVEKGCIEEDGGKFEAPYEKYSWGIFCTEIDFYLSESMAAMAAAASGADEDEVEEAQQDQFTKMVMQTASDYLTKSMRELHVEVYWDQRGNARQVNATTHFAKYDEKVSLIGSGQAQSEGGG